MQHQSKINNWDYQVMEGVCPENNSRYDMIIITRWFEANTSSDNEPEIVGYYFGDYDYTLTEFYVKLYVDGKKAEQQAVSSGWYNLVNRQQN